MTVQQLAALSGITAAYTANAAAEVQAGYTSDLLSDVVAHCPADSVLITIQAHANTVACATLVGVAAILVCSGREIPGDMLSAAEREGISILATQMNQFDCSFTVKSAFATIPN